MKKGMEIVIFLNINLFKFFKSYNLLVIFINSGGVTQPNKFKIQ